MMRAMIIAACLSGCAAAPQIVNVPVKVGCLGDLPARPVTRFNVGAWPSHGEAAKIAIIDALAWEKYASSLEVTMAGCDKK